MRVFLNQYRCGAICSLAPVFVCTLVGIRGAIIAFEMLTSGVWSLISVVDSVYVIFVFDNCLCLSCLFCVYVHRGNHCVWERWHDDAYLEMGQQGLGKGCGFGNTAFAFNRNDAIGNLTIQFPRAHQKWDHECDEVVVATWTRIMVWLLSCVSLPTKKGAMELASKHKLANA